MGHSTLFRRARMLCAVVFFAAAAAHADTIVLKNGRRIVANNVREEGDKVKYETSAGELSLPKSIVDHIEKGGGPMGDSSGAAAANLAITPPAMGTMSGGTEIERGAVHDGAIDREYIAKLEVSGASRRPARECRRGACASCGGTVRTFTRRHGARAGGRTYGAHVLRPKSPRYL